MNLYQNVDGVIPILIPIHIDDRGELAVIESLSTIPFQINRIFYIKKANNNKVRGKHANILQKQVIVCLEGSFDILVDDGINREVITMKSDGNALFIPGMIWRELYNFSNTAICLVICSDHYDPNDYYHEYSEFLSAKSGGK